MPLITIKVQVPDPIEVASRFTHIKIYRSTAGETGTYSEITVAATRPAIVSTQALYTFDDTNGDPTYWYKSSYYNSSSGLESSLSSAQEGTGDDALNIISVEELKEYYLFGLDLTDDAGEEMPDSLYEHYIRSAVSSLEHRLDIPISPITISEEKHDFFREEYRSYAFIQLDNYPVISVESVTMVLPGQQLVRTFDSDWIVLKKEFGQINIVPTSADASTLWFGDGSWYPAFRHVNRFIPAAFRVAYTAGFATGEVPPVIKDVIGKIASFGPLNIAGDLLGGAGIASQAISIDGLSQSFNTTSSATNAGYGARLIQYGKELKDVIPRLERYYKQVKLVVF